MFGSETKKMLLEALRGGKGASESDKGYGVMLDEMAELGAQIDPFDCCEFDGPDPPILHHAKKPVPYTVIENIGKDKTGDIQILQLAYNMVMPGYSVIFTGRRNSGKTKLIKAMCRHLRPYFPEVVVFTRTKASCEYSRFIPHSRVIKGFDPDLLVELMAIQESKKKAQSRGELKDTNYNLLVILDDCLGDRLQWSNELKAVFFEGRHNNITIFVSIQDVKGLAPAATGNADMVFLYPMGDERTMESVRDKYMYFVDKYEQKDILSSDEINKKFHVLGVDVRHRSNPRDFRLSVGCVDNDAEKEDFVMGTREMWEEDLDQLEELGFGHLESETDWGILKPSKIISYVKDGFPLIDLKTLKRIDDV
jgi:energy-coupling factor transporter ATP-binding protein EcfA2